MSKKKVSNSLIYDQDGNIRMNSLMLGWNQTCQYELMFFFCLFFYHIHRKININPCVNKDNIYMHVFPRSAHQEGLEKNIL